MSEIDIDALRALAERATPGPWRQEEETTLVWGACNPDDMSSRGMGFPVVETGLRPAWRSAEEASSPERRLANAAFIAAANPQTVLALLLRLEECEKALRPFAEIGAVVPEWVRDDDFVDVCTAQNMKDWRRIEYGQLRAAARCFQHSEKKADDHDDYRDTQFAAIIRSLSPPIEATDESVSSEK